MTAALPSAAIPAVILLRRVSAASEALTGVSSLLAGRLCASGLFGWIAVKPALGILDPLARRAACEARVDAGAHALTPSVLTVRGNRALLPSVVATSADLPNLAAQEV